MKYKLNFSANSQWGPHIDTAITALWHVPSMANGIFVEILNMAPKKSLMVHMIGLKAAPFEISYLECTPVKFKKDLQLEAERKDSEFTIQDIPQNLSWNNIFSPSNQFLKDGMASVPKGISSRWEKPANMNGEKVKVLSICDDLYPYAYSHSWYVYHDLYPMEFFPVPARNLFTTKLNPQKVCKCEVFVTGCVCGVFKEEQARKKAEG